MGQDLGEGGGGGGWGGGGGGAGRDQKIMINIFDKNDQLYRVKTRDWIANV
jgi:hypothetical protein